MSRVLHMDSSPGPCLLESLLLTEAARGAGLPKDGEEGEDEGAHAALRQQVPPRPGHCHAACRSAPVELGHLELRTPRGADGTVPPLPSAQHRATLLPAEGGSLGDHSCPWVPARASQLLKLPTQAAHKQASGKAGVPSPHADSLGKCASTQLVYLPILPRCSHLGATTRSLHAPPHIPARQVCAHTCEHEALGTRERTLIWNAWQERSGSWNTHTRRTSGRRPNPTHKVTYVPCMPDARGLKVIL